MPSIHLVRLSAILYLIVTGLCGPVRTGMVYRHFAILASFYSVPGLFTAYWDYLQHTGTIYSVLGLLTNLSYPVVFNFTLRFVIDANG